MAASLPQPLAEVVEQLARLPGLGSKSALRLAMTLLHWPESEARRLGSGILALRDKLAVCSRCGGIAAQSPCPICTDTQRERDVICVVPEWDSLLALEGGGFYRGQYLVLGGLLSPGQSSSQLDMDRLRMRLREGEIAEMVLALGSTLEAENTATYIREHIAREFPSVSITRLAQGMPLGAEVKHMDQETLRQSMHNRQKL